MSSQETAVKGYFFKKPRGRSLSNWQRRWMEFCPISNGKATVSWWKTEKDELNNRDKSCKGTIVLHASQSNARSISLKDHCMELTTSKGESLIFAAQDSFSYDTVKKLYSMLFSDLYAGTLWKRARKSGKNWKKRYICINRKTKLLMIFDSKKKFDGVHKNGIIGLSNGMIDLTKCVAHNSGLRQFGIEILVTDEPSLYLAANSLAEQKEWLSELQLICGSGEDLTKTMSARGKALFEAAIEEGVAVF